MATRKRRTKWWNAKSPKEKYEQELAEVSVDMDVTKDSASMTGSHSSECKKAPPNVQESFEERLKRVEDLTNMVMEELEEMRLFQEKLRLRREEVGRPLELDREECNHTLELDHEEDRSPKLYREVPNKESDEDQELKLDREDHPLKLAREDQPLRLASEEFPKACEEDRPLPLAWEVPQKEVERPKRLAQQVPAHVKGQAAEMVRSQIKTPTTHYFDGDNATQPGAISDYDAQLVKLPGATNTRRYLKDSMSPNRRKAMARHRLKPKARNCPKSKERPKANEWHRSKPLTHRYCGCSKQKPRMYDECRHGRSQVAKERRFKYAQGKVTWNCPKDPRLKEDPPTRLKCQRHPSCEEEGKVWIVNGAGDEKFQALTKFCRMDAKPARARLKKDKTSPLPMELKDQQPKLTEGPERKNKSSDDAQRGKNTVTWDYQKDPYPKRDRMPTSTLTCYELGKPVLKPILKPSTIQNKEEGKVLQRCNRKNINRSYL